MSKYMCLCIDMCMCFDVFIYVQCYINIKCKRFEKGIGGSTSNSIKELVSNGALSLHMERSAFYLIMLASEVTC